MPRPSIRRLSLSSGGFSPRAEGRCVLLGFATALMAAAGCESSPGEPRPGGRLKVVVSILPQATFVRRVGGDRVDVRVLVGPGQSYHSYEPTPRQLVDLSEARVFFRLGVPFETALLGRIRAVRRDLFIVDTTRGIPLRTMTASCVAESEPHRHHETAGAKDPHTWLSPRLVKIQARNIRDALVQLDPAGQPEYDRGLAGFTADLDALDAYLCRTLAPLKGREFFVFHPAYGYFADAYGLRQVAVEEEGKEPSGRHLAQLIARARRENVHVIFVQPQFARHSAEAIASAIGGAVVPLDPLTADYLANLRAMGKTIDRELRGASGGSAAQVGNSR